MLPKRKSVIKFASQLKTKLKSFYFYYCTFLYKFYS